MSEAKTRPGFITFKEREDGRPGLDDLWFFTGSRCNLECIHCYVESSPVNNSIDMIEPEDILPYLREAQQHGVHHIYFTGGEPCLNKRIYELIGMALEVADAVSGSLRNRSGMQALNRLFKGYIWSCVD